MKLTHLKRGAGGGAGAETNSPAAAPVIVDEKAAPASAAPAPPVADPGIERWLDDGASMVSPWPQRGCGITTESSSSFLSRASPKQGLVSGVLVVDACVARSLDVQEAATAAADE